MNAISRRATLRAFAVCTTALATLASAPAWASDPIRIGYAVARTGPSATGAGITTIPNYELWVKNVNEAGGLRTSGWRCRLCSKPRLSRRSFFSSQYLPIITAHAQTLKKAKAMIMNFPARLLWLK